MKDKSDVLEILNEFPDQIKDAVKLARKAKISISGKINNIVVCGVGVAGNAADICSSLTNKIPVFACKDYKVPSFVDKHSLVIALSYSGVSNETLSAYKDAKKKKAKTVLITGNENLAKKEKNSIVLPEQLIPRFSLAYLLMSTAVVLGNAKLISQPNIGEILRTLNVRECNRQGFLTAKKLKNKIPMIYSSPELYSVAKRIKCSINEKSKQVAFSNFITEVCYNEALSYKKFPKRYEILLLKDEKDSKGIKKHMNAFRKTLKNKNVIDFEIQGKSILSKLLYGHYVGDYIGYYLSLMGKQDPFEIKFTNDFKGNLE